VAKDTMVCPFSGRLCEECAVYRGRHYYLCFVRNYRGYLGPPGGDLRGTVPPIPGARPNGKFEIPSMIRVRAIDPFAADRESYPREEDT